MQSLGHLEESPGTKELGSKTELDVANIDITQQIIHNIDPSLETKVWHKMDFYILPVVCVMTFFYQMVCMIAPYELNYELQSGPTQYWECARRRSSSLSRNNK